MEGRSGVLPSRYNFWSETPLGSPLLFNGRTGSLIELNNRAEAGEVRRALGGEPSQLASTLQELGFLWDGPPSEEVDEVLKRRGVAGSTTRALEVTISPTYGCNFRCTYCYVQFDDPRMDDAAEARTLAFLESLIPQHPRTNITSFGGEPLLAWRRVARMAAAVSRSRRAIPPAGRTVPHHQRVSPDTQRRFSVGRFRRALDSRHDRWLRRRAGHSKGPQDGRGNLRPRSGKPGRHPRVQSRRRRHAPNEPRA